MELQRTTNAMTLHGSSVVHHNYIIWKDQLYTHPDLRSHDKQSVQVTELKNDSLLVTDQTSQQICTAEHVSHAYLTRNLYNIPINARPIVRHGHAFIGKHDSFVITEDAQVIPIHPQRTKLLIKKAYTHAFTVLVEEKMNTA